MKRELFPIKNRQLYEWYPLLSATEEVLLSKMRKVFAEDYKEAKSALVTLMGCQEIATGHEMQPSTVMILSIKDCGSFHFMSEIEMPQDSYYYDGHHYFSRDSRFIPDDGDAIVINRDNLDQASDEIVEYFLQRLKR